MIALAVAVVFYVVLPDTLTAGPRWLVPALEAALAIPLLIGHRLGRIGERPGWRLLAVAVIALVNLANVISVGLLVSHILGSAPTKGKQLLYSAVAIWITNVIVFGLWFWELDRGGPAARGTPAERHPDFQFPQMLAPELSPPAWHPTMGDYLYLGFTNATAFSPTDAMPVTVTAKSLMTIEALVSLVTVVVIAGRAINIIS
jgi:hypothetical protein